MSPIPRIYNAVYDPSKDAFLGIVRNQIESLFWASSVEQCFVGNRQLYVWCLDGHSPMFDVVTQKVFNSNFTSIKECVDSMGRAIKIQILVDCHGDDDYDDGIIPVVGDILEVDYSNSVKVLGSFWGK